MHTRRFGALDGIEKKEVRPEREPGCVSSEGCPFKLDSQGKNSDDDARMDASPIAVDARR
ncbi:hypothetical protein WS79_06300 [Burkholderia territorii]|nr:hypothetical protein WS79_06300 [Burkholderia territorii]